MPAGPLERRCWAGRAAVAREGARQWLTAALAAGTGHLAPELGVPLRLSLEWIGKTEVSEYQEGEEENWEGSGTPSTGRM